MAKFVHARQRADIDTLDALLTEDVFVSMRADRWGHASSTGEIREQWPDNIAIEEA